MAEQDMSIDLPPVKPRKSLAEKQAEAQTTDAATTLATTLAEALKQAAGVARSVAPTRYGEENKSEVVVRANRRVHISPADLAFSKIAGNAYGIDGRSQVFEEGDIIVMRDGPGLQSMVAQGKVRIEERR